MDWYVVEHGDVLNSPPYMSFSGAMVSSPARSRLENPELAKQDIWQRDVPQTLENSIVLDFSLREAKWAGGPVALDQLPAQMVIDYIRVYQLSAPQ